MTGSYTLVFVWVGFIALVGQYGNVYQTEIVAGKKERRVRWMFAFLAFLPLIWWAATRGEFMDTGGYITAYRTMPSSVGEMGAFLETVNKDKGFFALGVLIKSIVGDNYVYYFGVIAFIHGMALITVFRKYSSNYWLTIFLFVASTDYLSWMHNGIRQFTAVSLIFAAASFILDKKYVKTILIILLASTMHQSALLMLPVIFMVQGKAFNKKTVMASVVVLVGMMAADRFTGILDNLLADTQYTNVVSDWQTGNDDGTNPIRILVYSMPTLLAFLGYKDIRKADDPVINLACNMSMISTALYCLSGVTSGIFIGRLPIYCSLYGTGILLPWELEHIFTKKLAGMVFICMIGGYLVFYYYQTHFVWGVL